MPNFFPSFLNKKFDDKKECLGDVETLLTVPFLIFIKMCPLNISSKPDYNEQKHYMSISNLLLVMKNISQW